MRGQRRRGSNLIMEVRTIARGCEGAAERESVYGVRMRRVFGIFEGAVLKIEGNMYSGEVRDFYCNFYYLLYLKKSDEHKVEPK